MRAIRFSENYTAHITLERITEMNITHLYKGVEIEKVERYYMQGSEVFYRLFDKNRNLQVFDRLKDAKSFVDRENATKRKDG